MKSLFERLVADARDWCRGRSWIVRLPLWLWGWWILVHHLRSEHYQSLFGGLSFGIHELGHILFSPLGLFLGVAGGTIAETAAPLIGVLVFWRQRDYFGIAICALWEGTSLIGVSRYLADATERSLPLVSPFPGEPIHDWHYLLGRFGILSWDQPISRLVSLLGYASILTFLVAGAWLLAQMHKQRQATLLPPPSFP